MQSLIIGAGEVGLALQSILKCKIIDKQDLIGTFDIIHVCFPYSDQFEDEVKKYQQKYNPKHTVIHSTVPVGTSRKLKAIHSPIRGMHPELKKSILTFVKFIGGENSDEIADYFRNHGIKVQLCRKQETTELMKLLDTLYYGVCIEFAKEAERLCEKNEVPFSEVYTLANQSYNKGYEKLGYSEFIRPVLQPLKKKIGGHCVLQNTAFLESEFVELVRNRNQ